MPDTTPLRTDPPVPTPPNPTKRPDAGGPLTPPELKRHKASDRAYSVVEGRYIYFGKWGSARAIAGHARLVAEWAACGGRLPVAKEEITLVEIAADFLEHARRRYRTRDGARNTSTFGEIRIALEAALALYGELPAVQFGPLALRAVRHGWIDKGLCVVTINTYTSKIVQLFKWAASRELVPASAYQSLATVENLRQGWGEGKDSTPREPVPLVDVEATIPHLPHPLQAVVRLLLYTGARPSEILNLRRGDVDCSGPVWSATLATHKTMRAGKGRRLAFGPKCQAVLRPYLLRPDGAFLFDPREAEAARHAAERERTGGPGRRPNQAPNPRKTDRTLNDHYTYRSLGVAIERVCRKHGIPHWTPYQLRHRAATEIERTAGLETAKALLGHSGLDITQIYVHRDHAAADAWALQYG